MLGAWHITGAQYVLFVECFLFPLWKNKLVPFYVTLSFLLVPIPPICPANTFLSAFKIILQELGFHQIILNHVLKTQTSQVHVVAQGEGNHATSQEV